MEKAATMNPVIQEDVTGCGIASVAALAGVTYQEVKDVASQLGIQSSDPRLWSDTAFVRSLLSHYGFQTSPQEQPFTSWNTLPPLALLAIKWRQKHNHPYWHWVVFRRNLQEPVVLDSKRSLKNNLRRDFVRMKPKWFIALERTRPGEGSLST